MKISPFTVWYAPGDDSYCFERVQILRTITFPVWGRYILYRQIDWPDSSQPFPLCAHESVFLRLYTPQESEPCENLPQENSSSKTSWRERLSFYFAPLTNWGKTQPKKPNS